MGKTISTRILAHQRSRGKRGGDIKRKRGIKKHGAVKLAAGTACLGVHVPFCAGRLAVDVDSEELAKGRWTRLRSGGPPTT